MNLRTFLTLSLSLWLSGCASDFEKDDMEPKHHEQRQHKGIGKFLGADGLSFGGSKKRPQEDTGLGVNSYLWRAALDTISFMPLVAADPFGGVIITDWYSPPQSPKERLKINVLILDRQLRSDGLRVSIFRQEKDATGQWVDQPMPTQTVTDLETAILTRARHFKTTAMK